MKRLYASPKLEEYSRRETASPDMQQIYGPLGFPAVPDDRPYIVGCFVSSLDGGIVFRNSHDGSQIAKANAADPAGGDSDFWMLNALRASCDCIVLGANTLRVQPKMNGAVSVPDLLDARIASGKPEMPLQVVPASGKDDFPADHQLFHSGTPVVIASGSRGIDRLSRRVQGTCVDAQNLQGASATQGVTLLSCGEKQLDIPLLHRWLRCAGADQMLVESPGYFTSLLQQDLADELFLTWSSLFTGSGVPGITSGTFSLRDHPSAEVLSVHIHEPGFVFLRYRCGLISPAYI